MSNIYDDILHTQAEFENKTGKTPFNVYLGEVEMAALLTWAELHQYSLSAGTNRSQINGLNLYKVNAISHLGIS